MKSASNSWAILTILATLVGGVSFAADDDDAALAANFKKFDKDDDGELEGDEIKAFADSVSPKLREQFRLDRQSSISTSEHKEWFKEIKKEQAAGPGKAVSKPRVTMDLAEMYRAMDKNGDGQVSLSEWDRTKRSEFVKLDRNGDGFLAPRELATKSGGAKTLAGGPPVDTKAGGPLAKTQQSPGSASPPSAPVKPKAEEDRDLKSAKFFFTTVDKDKNGEISEEEWGKSRGIPTKFADAKVTPVFPMKEATFVSQYVEIQNRKK